MINFFKKNRIYKLIIICILVYAVYTLINQQVKLNAYNKDIRYYNVKIAELKNDKENLLAVKENVNSIEYIEKIAREKLDMYLPNERVYIDISK